MTPFVCFSNFFFNVSIIHIIEVCTPLEILNIIICFIFIDMVYFIITINVFYENFRNKTMNQDFPLLIVLPKACT